MDRTVLAIIIQETTKLFSEILRSRPSKPKESDHPRIHTVMETQVSESKAQSIATGCVPCSLGHLGTCTGLLNEAMRFARKDGISSEEVIDRINICTDELNSLERVDLRPEMIAELPDWEKELANKALTASRDARHSLESMKTVNDLEKVAAGTQSVRQEIGRKWFKERLSNMPEKEKAELAERAIKTIEEEE